VGVGCSREEEEGGGAAAEETTEAPGSWMLNTRSTTASERSSNAASPADTAGCRSMEDGGEEDVDHEAEAEKAEGEDEPAAGSIVTTGEKGQVDASCSSRGHGRILQL
jgi:hypothetical protein